LLGATFFDLLPEPISAVDRRDWTTCTELTLVVVGFVVFYLGSYLAERVVELPGCPACNSEIEAHRHVPIKRAWADRP